MDEITENELKEKLAKHYSANNTKSRKLIKNKRKDGNGGIGSVVYSLNGTPPKGYAIEETSNHRLWLYDHKGKRFKIYRGLKVVKND